MKEENKTEFNLLEENWIRVRKPDGKIDELPLPDTLTKAHLYTDLAGEMQAQDIAMLRLLLAVMHAVFSRVDEEGNASPIRNRKDALRRWKALWDRGSLPEKPIRDYLEQYRERFWLFHPDRPFYQANSAAGGTEYSVAKLNGALAESNNKIRLFPMVGKENKTQMDYAPAARWLLFINGYDDTSSKPKGKNLPSVGAGWLGKLGLVTAQGGSLFETLMLNFVLLDENDCPWSSCVPVWEADRARESERTEIPLPHDQAALLTLQSRRLLLKREAGKVTGYSLLGGDFFEKQNAFAEQMTAWRPVKKKDEVIGFTPARHDPARKMWQNFGSVIVKKEDTRQPGVVHWNMLLKQTKCIDRCRYLCCRETAVLYGDKDFFATGTYSDTMIMHSSLMDEAGIVCQRRIEDEILHCWKAAEQVGILAYEIELAEGGIDERQKKKVHAEEQKKKASEQFYYRIDLPFRTWLQSIDPSEPEFDIDACCEGWDGQMARIAQELGRELANAASAAACCGRTVSSGDNSVFFCVPQSYLKFQKSIRKFRAEKKEV